MSKHNGFIFDYLENGSISKGIKSLKKPTFFGALFAQITVSPYYI